MAGISASFRASLRASAVEYLSGTCTIYINDGAKDGAGYPKKVFTTPREDNPSTIPCSLQEVDRVPQTGEAGSRYEVNTEYNLKVPWGTLVEKGDQALVTDDTGRQTRVHILNPYRHSSGLTLTIRCKDIS